MTQVLCETWEQAWAYEQTLNLEGGCDYNIPSHVDKPLSILQSETWEQAWAYEQAVGGGCEYNIPSKC